MMQKCTLVFVALALMISNSEARVKTDFTYDKMDVTCEFTQDFYNYMKTFYPDYVPDAHLSERMQSFAECLQQVCTHDPIAAGFSKTYDIFCFMTTEEKEMILNPKHSRGLGTSSKSPHVYNTKFGENLGNFSWVDLGAVTPVKNQGSCGNCYTYAAAGAAEGVHKIQCGNLYNLSTQQYTDCSKYYRVVTYTSKKCIGTNCTTRTYDKWCSNNTKGNDVCSGGDYTACWAYNNMTNTLLYSSECYESTPNNSRANHTCLYPSCTDGVNITNYVRILENNETDLLQAVLRNPVACGVDTIGLSNYGGGVVDYDGADTNHAILVVGFGSTAAGKDFWIIKNSWGTRWGANGYFYLARGTNAGLIASSCSYPTIAPC